MFPSHVTPIVFRITFPSEEYNKSAISAHCLFSLLNPIRCQWSFVHVHVSDVAAHTPLRTYPNPTNLTTRRDSWMEFLSPTDQYTFSRRVIVFPCALHVKLQHPHFSPSCTQSNVSSRYGCNPARLPSPAPLLWHKNKFRNHLSISSALFLCRSCRCPASSFVKQNLASTS